MEFYYYTKWKFRADSLEAQQLDSVGPFHSTFVTAQNPKEFLLTTTMENLDEVFCKRFETEEEMKAFASSVGLSN